MVVMQNSEMKQPGDIVKLPDGMIATVTGRGREWSPGEMVVCHLDRKRGSGPWVFHLSNMSTPSAEEVDTYRAAVVAFNQAHPRAWEVR